MCENPLKGKTQKPGCITKSVYCSIRKIQDVWPREPLFPFEKSDKMYSGTNIWFTANTIVLLH